MVVGGIRWTAFVGFDAGMVASLALVAVRDASRESDWVFGTVLAGALAQVKLRS